MTNHRTFADDASLKPGDRYLANLRGTLIHCDSIEDALAVKKADDILKDGSTYCSAAELNRLADVVRRYNQVGVCEALHHRASRVQAAQFFNTPVDGSPPSP